MTTRQTHTVVLVDFDGTIMDTDTSKVALDKFGDPAWQRFDDALEKGEISFEESLRREFASLNAEEDVILEEVGRVANLRPHFDGLVRYCMGHALALTVVSGGLDFCIRHFLNQDDWLGFVGIYAPKSHFTGSGYSLTFPELFSAFSENFKDDLVKHEVLNGRKVWFIGDGFGDFPAAKAAQHVFAIRGSRLAELCSEHAVSHQEIDEFEPVIEALRRVE